MSVITDAIVGGLAWEAFSKSVAFYSEKINDMTLRAYIAMQLRGLDKLQDASNEQIEETAEIIETAIIETPEEIKQTEDKSEQKERFLEYLRISNSFKKIKDSILDIDLNGEGEVNNSFKNINNSTIKIK